MMALSVFSGEIDLGSKIYIDYQKEFKKKKRTNQKQAELFMYKVILSDKPHAEILNKKEIKIVLADGMISEALRRHNIAIFLKRKKFGKVYDLYEKKRVKTAQIHEKIIYDLAGILSKKANNKLLCEQQYKEFPMARKSSYSMTICGMLLDVKNGKRPKKKDLKRLELILKKYPSKRYLTSVAKNLY